jgi:hypothetical protein
MNSDGPTERDVPESYWSPLGSEADGGNVQIFTTNGGWEGASTETARREGTSLNTPDYFQEDKRDKQPLRWMDWRFSARASQFQLVKNGFVGHFFSDSCIIMTGFHLNFMEI